MTKSKSQGIVIIDNDVLVYLFEKLYDVDQLIFYKVIEFLTLKYSAVWIPGTVKEEFLNSKKMQRRRKRRLNQILNSNYSFIDCPINVADHEIDLINPGAENRGEADGTLQGKKAMLSDRYGEFDYFFLSNDSGALNLAESMQIQPFRYSELKNIFREIGIFFPF